MKTKSIILSLLLLQTHTTTTAGVELKHHHRHHQSHKWDEKKMKDLEDMGRPEKPLSSHGGKGEDRFDSAPSRRRADEEEAFYDDEVPAPLPAVIPIEARETAVNSDGDSITNTGAERSMDDEDDDDDDTDEQIDKSHLPRRIDAYKSSDPVSPSRLRGVPRPTLQYEPVEGPVRRYEPAMEYEPFTPEPQPFDGPEQWGTPAPLPVYRPTYDGEYEADEDAVDNTSFDEPLRAPKTKFKVFGKHKAYNGRKRHHKKLRDMDMEDEDAVISRRSVDMEADDDEPSVLKFEIGTDKEPVPVKAHKKRSVKGKYKRKANKPQTKLKKKKTEKD